MAVSSAERTDAAAIAEDTIWSGLASYPVISEILVANSARVREALLVAKSTRRPALEAAVSSSPCTGDRIAVEVDNPHPDPRSDCCSSQGRLVREAFDHAIQQLGSHPE